MLAGKGIIRAGEGSEKKFLIRPHLLTNLEIPTDYQNELRFNGVYSRYNSADKIKYGAYIVNLMSIMILEVNGWHYT